MSSKNIGTPARRAIFEAMVAMAWADARIEREEVLAVQAAGRVLDLPEDVIDTLDAGPPPIQKLSVSSLSPPEKRLVYLCAAWLACVDAREDEDEDKVLEELREVLGLNELQATTLRDDARLLRAKTPASVHWHEELSTLIDQADNRLQPWMR